MMTNIISNSSRKYCKKCQRYGNHTEVLCNEKVEELCCYCGQSHSFASRKCRSQICTNCHKFHFTDPACQASMSKLKCSICNLNGHSDELCTNNWRLFHSVTDLNDLSSFKPPVLRYCRGCVTCGSEKHSPFECPMLRNTIHFCNLSPTPKITNRLKEKFASRLIDSEMDEESEIVIEDESSTQPDDESKFIKADQNDVKFAECDRSVQRKVNEFSQASQTDEKATKGFKKSKNPKMNKKMQTNRERTEKRDPNMVGKIKSVATSFNQISMQNVSQFTRLQTNKANNPFTTKSTVKNSSKKSNSKVRSNFSASPEPSKDFEIRPYMLKMKEHTLKNILERKKVNVNATMKKVRKLKKQAFIKKRTRSQR